MIHSIFENFAGDWVFERRVLEDKKILYAEGICIFAPTGPRQYSYQENGVWKPTYNGVTDFSRCYVYERDESTLNVYYGDGLQTGALYQSYMLSPCGKYLTAEKIHFCGPDQYIGRYELIDAQNFALTTEVTGQNKNYRMVTNYRRA